MTQPKMPRERTMLRCATDFYIAIVRRGETSVLRTLLRALGARPGPIQIIWDRRASQRRKARRAGAPERRRGERRRPLPAMWRRLGYFFAPSRRGGPEPPAAPEQTPDQRLPPTRNDAPR
jgi:hypothetical protein